MYTVVCIHVPTIYLSITGFKAFNFIWMIKQFVFVSICNSCVVSLLQVLGRGKIYLVLKTTSVLKVSEMCIKFGLLYKLDLEILLNI